MAKIDKEEECFYAFRALYKPAELCHLHYRCKILVEKYPEPGRVEDLNCAAGCLVPGELYLSQIE